MKLTSLNKFNSNTMHPSSSAISERGETCRMAPEKLQAVDGLHKLCKWIEGRGIKRAAVTNAPRANAQLMISLLGLTDFFQLIVVGSECDRPKPYPDPYLKALKDLGASPNHTFVFEVVLLLLATSYDVVLV